MEKRVCDQCGNHCPEDALQCGRGRRYFGMQPPPDSEGRHGHPLPEGPVGLLRQCGHLLHHGGVGGGDLLKALSAEEQAELERLLTVLLADWKTRQPAGGPHHGRP